MLLDLLMAMMGGEDSSKLKKCLEQLWDFIASLNLAPEDAKKLKKTVQNHLNFRKAGNNFLCRLQEWMLLAGKT